MSAIICAAATMSPCIEYLKNPITHTEPAAQPGIRDLRVRSSAVKRFHSAALPLHVFLKALACAACHVWVQVLGW